MIAVAADPDVDKRLRDLERVAEKAASDCAEDRRRIQNAEDKISHVELRIAESSAMVIRVDAGFGEFKLSQERRLTDMDKKIETGFSMTDKKIEDRFTQMQTNMDKEFTHQNGKVEELRKESSVQARLGLVIQIISVIGALWVVFSVVMPAVRSRSSGVIPQPTATSTSRYAISPTMRGFSSWAWEGSETPPSK